MEFKDDQERNELEKEIIFIYCLYLIFKNYLVFIDVF